METNIFDPNAPKKSTNVTINSDLLRQAKERRINLSQALESHLTELLREEKSRRWQEENRDAIDDFNHRIETTGTFSDGLRRF